MDSENKYVVVLGRFRPIGCNSPTFSGEGEAKTCERYAALLRDDGEPICQQVRLERIVQQPSVTKEQAHREFLHLTEGK